MNETQLRDRLHAATADVTPQSPALQALRGIAHRRRRRVQTVLAALVVLVLVAVGIGVGVGTGSGPRSVQTVMQQAADVTVPCASGAVTLKVGQTLAVAPCADAGAHTVGPVLGPAVHLATAGAGRFRATAPGTFPLTLEYTGCRSAGTACAADQHVVGTITTTVLDVVPDTLALSCGDGHAQLVVGEVVDLGCAAAPGFTTYSVNPRVVRALSLSTFQASAVGIGRIALARKGAACRVPGPDPGCENSAQILFLDVTVIAAPGTFAASGPPRLPTVPSSPPVSLPPSTASLEVPCGPIAVTMALGQTLSLPCELAVGHLDHGKEVPGDKGVLVRTRGVLVATKAGVATLTPAPGCSGGATCPPLPPVVVTVRIGARDTVSTCSDGLITIPVGAAVVITGCGLDVQVSSRGAALSRSGHTLSAVAPGPATVTAVYPACDAVPASVAAGCAGAFSTAATIAVTVSGSVTRGSLPR